MKTALYFSITGLCWCTYLLQMNKIFLIIRSKVEFFITNTNRTTIAPLPLGRGSEHSYWCALCADARAVIALLWVRNSSQEDCVIEIKFLAIKGLNRNNLLIVIVNLTVLYNHAQILDLRMKGLQGQHRSPKVIHDFYPNIMKLYPNLLILKKY